MAEANLFLNAAHTAEYAAGQTIFTVGDPGDVMYGVADGEVEILAGGEVIENLGPGDFFGEMAIIEHLPRSAEARAKTDCTLAAVDEKNFTFMVQEAPFFAMAVLRKLSMRLRRQTPE